MVYLIFILYYCFYDLATQTLNCINNYRMFNEKKTNLIVTRKDRRNIEAYSRIE